MELKLAPVALGSDLQQRRLLLDQSRWRGVLGPFLNAESYKLVLILFQIYRILRCREHFVNLVQNIRLKPGLFFLSVLRLRSFRFAVMSSFINRKTRRGRGAWRSRSFQFRCWFHLLRGFCHNVNTLILLPFVHSHECLVDEVVIRGNEFINEVIRCVGRLQRSELKPSASLLLLHKVALQVVKVRCFEMGEELARAGQG